MRWGFSALAYISIIWFIYDSALTSRPELYLSFCSLWIVQKVFLMLTKQKYCIFGYMCVPQVLYGLGVLSCRWYCRLGTYQHWCQTSHISHRQRQWLSSCLEEQNWRGKKPPGTRWQQVPECSAPAWEALTLHTSRRYKENWKLGIHGHGNFCPIPIFKLQIQPITHTDTQTKHALSTTALVTHGMGSILLFFRCMHYVNCKHSTHPL